MRAKTHEERRQGVPGDWRPAAASLVAYAAITAILGRIVISQLGSAIANDAGDPLLTAAILHWNAYQLPLTAAWWQFPIFFPTADALAFSEHLLGVSLLASPIAWVTGNPLAAYNVTMLLTFPLAAMAMYALVYRLTGSAAGAFIAGLACAFAPYRMATLSHIQILAVWWAPLALLGLHGYVEGGRGGGEGGSRKQWRWLALYGAAWMLQVASNLYALVMFTLLVGLWVTWFVVARRDWRALGAIAAATALAMLLLAPVLYKYAAVHAMHGFQRSLSEMQAFSADLAAPLCAPATLSFWGWVRVACRGEGELFPGAVIFALLVAAAGLVLIRDRLRSARVIGWVTRALVVVAALYAAIVAVFLVGGPISVDAGLFRLSVSSLDKPVLIGLAAGVAALLLSLAVRALSLASTLAFYVFAAVTTWLLTLGPAIRLMGEVTGRSGPFALMAWLPGASSLRVPARFWLMTMLCLAVVAGLVTAQLVKGRSPRLAAVLTLVLACGVLADGWSGGIPAQPPPGAVANASVLRGQAVLELPIDPYPDIAATWHAVTGGWSAVNGYSGNAPSYYAALTSASRLQDDAVFAFRRDRDLHVVVRADAPELNAFVERQPGAVVTGSGATGTQYRLPRDAQPVTTAISTAIPIARVDSPCMPADLRLLHDEDDQSLWACPPGDAQQEITIDLGAPRTIGSVIYGLGPYNWVFATQLAVETSVDGASWSDARRGSILAEVVAAAPLNPRVLDVALAFAPREARYIRVRPIEQQKDFHWAIAELAVRSR